MLHENDFYSTPGIIQEDDLNLNGDYMFRHFHPRYQFNYQPYHNKFSVLAMPRRAIISDIRRADIILSRSRLAGNTKSFIITNPLLLSTQELPANKLNSAREGYYLEVFGNTGSRNEKHFIRVTDSHHFVPENIMIVRNNYPVNNNELNIHAGIDDRVWNDNDPETGNEFEDITIPPLIGKETVPALETMYVGINLGLGKECYKVDKDYNCTGNLKYNVEAKTAIFIPPAFIAGSEIDLLIYLHGHKTGYMSAATDIPVDRLWSSAVQPKFSFREILNDSGKNMILVVPNLGPRSQPGSLVTNSGFTSFIDQVIISLTNYCKLYENKEAPFLRSIILAAHSGGGTPMRKIAGLAGTNAYAGLISECWGFDCTYSKQDPDQWSAWAKANPAKNLYIYSIDGSSTAKIAKKLAAGTVGLSNVFLQPSATDDHNSVPGYYLKEKLGTKAPVQPVTPTEDYFEHDNGCDCENCNGSNLFTEDNTPAFCTTGGTNILLTQLQQQVVDTTKAEHQWWQNGPAGPQVMEGTTAGVTRITSYWANVPGAPAHTVPGSAWSAVFVSFCVRQASLALNIDPIPFYLSSGHFHYAKSAYNRRFHNPPQPGYYWAYDPALRAVQAGDIIVKERLQKSGHYWGLTFDSLRTENGAQSHGDIVIEIQSNPNRAIVVGDNLGGSVNQNSYLLTADNRVDTTQIQYNATHVFAILSLEPLADCPVALSPQTEEWEYLEALYETDDSMAEATSVTPPPETIVPELAVLPFSEFDRKAFYGDFLASSDNEKITVTNNRNFTDFKVPYAVFLSQLEKYVDLGIIQSVYELVNKDKVITRNPASFDVIVTEAIHQFQQKCSNDKNAHTGKINSHLLDNLGFVFHKNRNSYYPKDIVVDILRGMDSEIKRIAGSHPIAALRNANAANWYQFRCNPVVFGRKGQNGNGYSDFFIPELRKAEAALFKIYMKELDYSFESDFAKFNSLNQEILDYTKLARHYGSYPLKANVPHALANILDIHVDHSDMRNEDPDKPDDDGFHFSGMALDIKVTLNPYVLGTTGKARLLEAADHNNNILNSGDTSRQINITEISTSSTASEYFHKLGKTLTTSEIYDRLNLLSEAFVALKISKGTADNTVKWGGSSRQPNAGFLNLDKNLVVVLRDQVLLGWGAVDFGENANGDMMHFDMRTLEMGLPYGKGSSASGITTFKQVHPKYKTTTKIPAENTNIFPENNWFPQNFEKIDSLVPVFEKRSQMEDYLELLYQAGVKDPEKLTSSLVFTILHPKPVYNPQEDSRDIFEAQWDAVLNSIVIPFLILKGRAVKTPAGNLLVPGGYFEKNEYGMVMFPLSGPGFARYTENTDDTYVHPVTKVKGKHGDNWVDPQTAEDFYNAIQDFHDSPEGKDVIIHYGDISAYDPAINLGHHTHNHGKAIDIHYFGAAGEEIFHDLKAYSKGDVTKMNAFFEVVQRYGFTFNFSFGKRFTHTGSNNDSGHKDHFHIGKALPSATGTESFAPEYTEAPAVSGSGAATIPAAKLLDKPYIFIRPLDFVWRSAKLPLNNAGTPQVYSAMAGCLPKDLQIYFDVTGEVVIRSKTTTEEIPYNTETNKVNFPGKPYFPEIDIITGKGMDFGFYTRVPVKIATEGKFESRQNNLLFKSIQKSATFWIVLSDPKHVETPPKDVGSAIVLNTADTDILELCESAATADSEFNRYSAYYSSEITKRIPLNNNNQSTAIAFDKKELAGINYYLLPGGLLMRSNGFLFLVPGWKAMDYWCWNFRNTLWNDRNFLKTFSASLAKDKLLLSRKNHIVGRDKPLPFSVFIGALRRFEDIIAGDLTMDQIIRLLRRAGHESSLPFDDVLGLPKGEWQEYSNNEAGGEFQFLKDHNRVTVGGYEIDFYHLFVGLDALSRDKGPNDFAVVREVETKLERAAGTTWAGDIGSAQADFSLRIDKTEEAKRKLSTKESLLDYYWSSRVATADLDGEIMAWGIYELKKTIKTSRLSDILLHFFHPATVHKNRKNAFRLLTKHYSIPGKPTELDMVRVEAQINEFGNLWRLNRIWLQYAPIPDDAIENFDWALSELASRFLVYVEGQAK